MPCASWSGRKVFDTITSPIIDDGILLRSAGAADDDFRDHRHFAGTNLRVNGWRMEKSHGDASQAVLVFYCMHAKTGRTAAGQRV
jgi:hypothetical protein